MEQQLLNEIIDYCMTIPALQQRENRDMLLRGLPKKPVATLSRSNAALTDMATIVQTAAEWGWIETQKTRALAMLLENTRTFIEGLQQEHDLDALVARITSPQSAPAPAEQPPQEKRVSAPLFAAEVRQQIADVLNTVPVFHDSPAQQAFVASTDVDPQFAQQLRFGLPSGQFVELLVSRASQYGILADGRHALEAVLEAVKQSTGQEGRAECDRLLQIIGRQKNDRSIPLEDTQESSESEDLSIATTPLLESYLNWLRCDARQISLTGIDRRVASSDEEGCQNLDAIYTALLTIGAEYPEDALHEEEDHADRGKFPGRRRSQLSALAQLDRHRHLVLLGDPGSGKSTFVNFVAMCMAGAALGDEHTYIQLLTEPLPDEKGEAEEERQPWRHGVLLPVRITLRDFAARGFSSDERSAGPDLLWQFLTGELQQIAPELGHIVSALKHHFLTKGGMLLLDGLDEVPDAERFRTRIKNVVENFARIYHRCHIVVTSRIYAYQKQGWRLNDFQETVLSPFSRGQICRFVDRWYPNVAASYDLNHEQARHRAAQLKHQILTRRALYSLAERPLLLTLMASLHAWRLRDLPKKRVELYKETVDLLLDRWERRKFKTQEPQGQPKSLLEWLKIPDKEAVLALLSDLAYKAHKNQLESSGTTADIPEKDLVDGLLSISDEDVRPKLLVTYLRDRAGLLLPHGVKVYTFPHRTFQEYLAACFLTGQAEYPDNAADLVRHDPNRWREVLLLAAASSSHIESMSWLLAEALCYQDLEPQTISPENTWGALLAGQVLMETANLTRIIDRNQPKLHRIRHWLAAILTEHVPKDDPFPAVERALAGNILARLGDNAVELRDGVRKIPPNPPLKKGGTRSFPPFRKGGLGGILTNDHDPSQLNSTVLRLGDPRPGVGLRDDSLPDIVWCDVTAGAFVMGSNEEEMNVGKAYIEKSNLDDDIKSILMGFLDYESPQHTVFLSPYQISRYPVTNAQYQRFVEEGGYSEKWKHCWTPEGWEWKEERQLSQPDKEGGEFDLANHPAVMISWYEASAFCQWFTLRLRETGNLTDTQRIRLPTEAEWEKAARGEDRRIFPWGNKDITPEHANYGDAGLGVTSTVGCFPRGVSPYGCEEMAGNVWEWCQDWFDENYYSQSPKEAPLGPASGSNRVIRGGSWDRVAERCRSAHRYGYAPGNRLVFFGFRLLRTPS